MNIEDPDYSNYTGMRHLHPETVRTLRAGLDNGCDSKSFFRKMKKARKYAETPEDLTLSGIMEGALRFMVRNPDAGVIRWTEGEQYVFVEMERNPLLS